jgi:hypothetical protein
MKKVSLFLFITFLSTGIYAQGKQQQLINSYVGEHKITLQWLNKTNTDKFKPGKITISQEAGTFNVSIKGEQRKSETEYVAIEGKIEPISAIEFKFIGKIESQVSYINEGKLCIKEGTYTFKKWNGRVFWRLQEKMNCDGTSTDYIDIF